MTCAAWAERHVSVGSGDWRNNLATEMSKHYRAVKKRLKSPTGGIVEAIEIAIVEFTCLGEKHYDLQGYPYTDTQSALAADWKALGIDMRNAVNKVAASEHLTAGGTEAEKAATPEIEERTEQDDRRKSND